MVQLEKRDQRAFSRRPAQLLRRLFMAIKHAHSPTDPRLGRTPPTRNGHTPGSVAGRRRCAMSLGGHGRRGLALTSDAVVVVPSGGGGNAGTTALRCLPRAAKNWPHDTISGCLLSSARRWRSVMPPQTPNSIRLSSASAAHSAITGQWRQTTAAVFCAAPRTKNSSALVERHRAFDTHASRDSSAGMVNEFMWAMSQRGRSRTSVVNYANVPRQRIRPSAVASSAAQVNGTTAYPCNRSSDRPPPLTRRTSERGPTLTPHPQLLMR